MFLNLLPKSKTLFCFSEMNLQNKPPVEALTFDSSMGLLKVIGFTTQIYRGLLTLSLLAIKVDVNPTNAEKKLLDKLHGLPENAPYDKVAQNELERIHWDLRQLKNELAVILEYEFDLSSSIGVEKLQNLRLKM